MKKFSLMLSLLMWMVVLTGCGSSDSSSDGKDTNATTSTYAVESCNKYLDFMECISAFTMTEPDQEQVATVLDTIKAEWETLSDAELKATCDERWDIILSTPELANHPQCGVTE